MAKVIIENVRGSFVYVAEQRKKDGQENGYGMQVILDADDKQVKRIEKAIDKALVEKFGEKALKLRKKFKLPLRDGDDEDHEESPHLEGKVFFNANNKKKPGIQNKQNEKADLDDIEEYCYSGAYFHVSINFYGFDVDGNKGVAAGLNGVMLHKHGDRLGGGGFDKGDFNDFADDDDFDDEDDF